ncbi:MAG: PD40 domain-containing protein [Gemmatimonadota bacterium]|nr:MAG: PD40 domain-containing protein [Gemmatimonadota bacterium]
MSSRRHRDRVIGLAGPILAAVAAAFACTSRSVTLELEFREGTMMEAVPSPDGSRLALQLWGHIWIVDAEGGAARCLTDAVDPPDEHWFPRWSPDGDWIVHSSNRPTVGLVIVPVAGGAARVLTEGEFDWWASWSPDGVTIVFSRGGSALWTVPSRGGDPERLTPDTLRATEPAWSPDGSRIAFSSNGRLLTITPDGETIGAVTSGPGDHAPSWHPSGAELFFLSSRSGSQQVWSVPAGGGEPRQLTDDAEMYPYAPRWLSGRERLIYTEGGAIGALDPASGTTDTIPFVARMLLRRETYERKRPQLHEPGDRVHARGIYWPAPSPDGSRIAFAALGDLWLRHADGRVERLTDGPADDGDPAWSPDGRAIAYVSDEAGDYQLYVLDLESGARRQVTDLSGHVTSPLWHPSGDSIVYVQGTSLHIVAAGGGTSRQIDHARAIDVRPLGWTAEGGGLVYLLLSYDRQTWAMSSRLMLDGPDGGSRLPIEHAWEQLDFATLSPDGQLLAYVDRGEGWIRSLIADSAARRVGEHATFFPSWSADGQLIYVSGGELRRIDVATGRDEVLPLDLYYEVPRSAGTVLIRNARLLTPEPREGLWDVLLADGLINSIGPSGELVGTADTVIDVDRRTVIPGLIDTHIHMSRGLFAPEAHPYWGVTAVAGAGWEGHWVVEQKDVIESGRRPGPRIFPAAGFVVPSVMNAFPQMLRVDTQEQLDRHLDHLLRLGATQVKHFNRRNPWVLSAAVRSAHEGGLPVLSHFTPAHAVAAGLDRKEHAFHDAWNGEGMRFRQDILEVLREAGITVSATLPCVGTARDSTGSSRIQPAFSDPELSSFLAPSAVRQVERLHQSWAEQDWTPDFLEVMLANARAAHDAGVRVVAGTDWQPSYLALHWELELLVEAGLSPLEALRAATLDAARTVGVDGRLGVIEEGAFADLVVLDADPLEDIRNTQKIYAVIKNGEPVDRARLLAEARLRHESE